MIDLKKINVILTGSTGGIGGAILESLYNSNANIIATGTNQDKLNKIKEKFSKVITKKFDILEHNSIEKFVDECSDIFQNNQVIGKVLIDKPYPFGLIKYNNEQIENLLEENLFIDGKKVSLISINKFLNKS